MAEEREKQPYIEPDADLLRLAAEGGDRNLIEARDRIHAMTTEERRRLRQALSRLDDLLDAVVIERRLARLKQPDCK
jgi:molybdopterin-guanine dinucleotide biosynthesis protein